MAPERPPTDNRLIHASRATGAYAASELPVNSEAGAVDRDRRGVPLPGVP
jgi:hypothetical protein